jgi:hypothetical protein
VAASEAPLLRCSFDCQIADHSHISDQLRRRGRLRQSDFSGLMASAKCAESNAGLPDLHRFVFEFCMNMVAG